MRYNIIDALVSVLLVFFLLPPFGIKGYVVVIYICEILNAVLSLGKLFRCVSVRCSLAFSVIPTSFCMAGAAAAAHVGAGFFNIGYDSIVITMAVGYSVMIVIYTFLLRTFGLISEKDKRWFLGIFKKSKKNTDFFAETS